MYRTGQAGNLMKAKVQRGVRSAESMLYVLQCLVVAGARQIHSVADTTSKN